jgi:hypothetical protein
VTRHMEMKSHIISTQVEMTTFKVLRNGLQFRIVLKRDYDGLRVIELDPGGRAVCYSIRALENVGVVEVD